MPMYDPSVRRRRSILSRDSKQAEIAEKYSRGELLYQDLPEVARELERIDAFLQKLAEEERA